MSDTNSHSLLTKNSISSFLLPLVILAALPLFGITQYTISLLISVMLYVILTVSWSVFSAPTGYMSLATAAFFGVGVYTTAVLGEVLPLIIVIIIGGLFSVMLAFLVGLSCLRLKGVYFSIFTFGLSELILHSVLFFETEFAGTVGRLVVGLGEIVVYYAMFAIVVILLIMVNLLRVSKFGFALESIGQAELAAASMGVNVNAIKILTFAFGAFFMGLAGGITVTQWTYVDARTAFNMFYSFMPALMAIFGGIKKIRGQILGAVILTLLAESLLIKFPYQYMLIFGFLVVTVILFFPSGLIGLLDIIKKRRKLTQ